MTRFLVASATLFVLSVLPTGIHAQGKGKGGGGGQAKDAQKEQHAVGHAQTAPAKARGNERARNESAPQQTRGVVPRGKAVGKVSEPPGMANARAHGGNAKALGVERRDLGGDVSLPREMPRSVAAISNARGPFVREVVLDKVPVTVRTYILSDRPEDRLAGKTVALAFARGVAPDVLTLQPLSNGVVIVNQSGVALLGLDESSAANLGGWKVVSLSDRVESKAPSFCRSGGGHPVWGRQWCIDKGFGLGTTNGLRWARTNLSDVVFHQPTATELITAAVLRQIIGPTAFDRLATHAITLGLVDPLSARWLGEATGPRTLYVLSGTYPVAELVDVNRDGRPETMLVALRPW